MNRIILWDIIERRGYATYLMAVTEALCQNTKTIMNTGWEGTKAIPTNRGVRHGCSLSQRLFTTWAYRRRCAAIETINPCVTLTHTCIHDTVLFLDGQTIIQKTGDDLQYEIYRLYHICQDYNIKYDWRRKSYSVQG